ncbi:MAG: hypothetical protein LBC18_03840 [Opitutaceae bacterium]|nr:hypothetical protein [Opitutaceae bacterium]
MSISFPTKPEIAKVVIDPAVNAALEHVADSLCVSKSAYIEGLLRAKFGIGRDRLLLKNLAKEGIYQHLLEEAGRPPPELQAFSFQQPRAGRKKPGARPRAGITFKIRGMAAHNPGAIGAVNIGSPRQFQQKKT